VQSRIVLYSQTAPLFDALIPQPPPIVVFRVIRPPV
jgi:hypothetical protein